MPVKEVPVPTGEEDAEAVAVEDDAAPSAESEESSKEEKVSRAMGGVSLEPTPTRIYRDS